MRMGLPRSGWGHVGKKKGPGGGGSSQTRGNLPSTATAVGTQGGQSLLFTEEEEEGGYAPRTLSDTDKLNKTRQPKKRPMGGKRTEPRKAGNYAREK